MTVWASRILDAPVWDAQNTRLGQCLDLLVADVEKGLPPLRAIAVGHKKGPVKVIPAESLAWLGPASLVLNTTTPPTYTPKGDELWLRRQVLDRQIVDTEGRRLVRVNDLQLVRRNSHYALAGVDVGALGFARRMGMEGVVDRLYQIARRQPPESVIPWRDMAAVEGNAPIRLRVSRDKISHLHPADIATIVSGLDFSSSQALMTALDTPTVADTMAEIEPELQVTILENLPPERAADVLEEMDPDDAADLLADLEPNDREQLLDLMEDDEARDVIKLLTYPEDSAGGVMSTEYTTIPQGLTVAEALDYVRRSAEAHDDETMYYIYIVDEENRLSGVTSLRDLVMAPPDSPVAAISQERPVTVDVLTPQTEVARVIAKYNLLAVPVVDEQGVFHGIVTVDDAIDAIIPTAWKKRLPRFY